MVQTAQGFALNQQQDRRHEWSYQVRKGLPLPLTCAPFTGRSISATALPASPIHHAASTRSIDSISFTGTGTHCKTHKLHESGQGGGRLEGIPTNPANDGVDL